MISRSDNSPRSCHNAPTLFFPALFILTIFCLSLVFGYANPAQAAPNPRYSSIVMDADTGMILHERYADKRLHPASLVKMMTLLMTFDALEKGHLRLRDKIRISQHAASMVPSKLDLPVGSTIRVEDAIYALATKSANDVAVALAERLGGTEDRFATMMTRKAREIGMTRTVFRNASGLHDKRQTSTARDMAKLARYLVQAYPYYYAYFSTETFSYRGKTYRNHNRLMASYNGMDGIKTGYIRASGFNLVASAKRGDRRLIGVVFGGRTSRSRNAHMKSLLDRGFTKMEDVLMASAAPLKAPLPQHKPLQVIRLAALEKNSTRPASSVQIADSNTYRDSLAALLQSESVSAMIGEGDYDPTILKRFETGLIAVAAATGEPLPTFSGEEDFSLDSTGEWAIQIGAFHSRVKTDKAIRDALNKLPAPYKKQAVATIVPLRTEQGWLYRGRLNGFNKDSAAALCRVLPDCLPVSPTAY